MTAVTRDGKPGIHYFQGKAMNEHIYPDYDAPISDERKAFIGAAAEAILGEPVQVIGGLWRYEHSTDSLTREKGCGHYQIQKQDGTKTILAVHPVDLNEALAMGDTFFAHLETQGVPVLRAGPFAEGQFVREYEGLFFHQEPFTPNLDWIIQEDDISGLGSALGEMAGKMYKAARSYEGTSALWNYTEEVMAPYIVKGLGLLKSNQSIEQPFAKLGVDVQDLIDRFSKDRLPGTLNFSEKMVRVTSGDGTELVFCAYDSPVRATMPMITDNASTDTALALGRIILNEALYEGCENPSQAMQQNLNSFICAHNEHSGLSLSHEESFEAAGRVVTMLAAYSFGAQDEQMTHDVITTHFNKTILPFAEKLTKIKSKLQFGNSGPTPYDSPGF